MKVKDELKRLGVSQGQLAVALNVSRATVNRMKGEESSDELMEVLQKLSEKSTEPVEVPMAKKLKNWDDYSTEEIRKLCKRRGGLEGNTHRVKETDYEISHSLGLRVFEFNKMVDKLRQIGLKRGYEQVEEMKKAGTWPPVVEIS